MKPVNGKTASDILFNILTTEGQDQPDKLVVFIKEHLNTPEHRPLVERAFNFLLAAFFPLLKKMSRKMFSGDRLIEKHSTRLLKHQRRQIWSEDYTIVVGMFWELILKFDPSKGVYFTYFLTMQLDWECKKIWQKRKTLKYGSGVIVKSYEADVEGLTDEELHSIPTILGMKYDDNFEQVTFEWALDEPIQFVENEPLYELLESLTEKQREAYAFVNQGYFQEQVADRIKDKTGYKISQQAVNERLLGVQKKIDKVAHLRGGDEKYE
ncbi:hypothetical protein GAY21_23550 [Phocaeicola vulgatus]|nr:hypothetical protein GAY21_23550 [Phocaeicola vulgatus]